MMGYTTVRPVWSDIHMDYRICQRAPGWHGSVCCDMDHEALFKGLNKEQGYGAAGLTHAFQTLSNL